MVVPNIKEFPPNISEMSPSEELGCHVDGWTNRQAKNMMPPALAIADIEA